MITTTLRKHNLVFGLRQSLVGIMITPTGTAGVRCVVTVGQCAASDGLVAQRITRLTTDQKIAGSNPAEIDFFFILEVSQ